MDATTCLYPRGWSLLECPHGSRKYAPKRCRTCVGCGEARRRKVIAKAINHLQGQPWISFMTITSLPGQDWPGLMKHFTALRRYLVKFQPGLQYLAVKETGADTGMKHLHVIWSGWVWHDYQDLTRAWASISGAWNIDIRRRKNAAVAAYTAKYISKAPPDIRKVVTYSRGWSKLPKDGTWKHLDNFLPADPLHRTPLVTPRGELVDYHARDCPCIPEYDLIDTRTSLWLSSILARSQATSPALSVT